jgi:hypothetical protein
MISLNAAQRNARVAILSVFVWGCGNRGSQALDRPPIPQGGEAVGTTASALIGGSPNPSVNVTQGRITNSSFESETAAVTLDSPAGTTLGHAVAYNSGDTTPGHTQGTGANFQVCKGYSMSAFSFALNSSPFLTGASFSGTRFSTPSGISMLTGDPSIIVFKEETTWVVYVASDAISDAAWGQSQCLPAAELPNSDQICVSYAAISSSGQLIAVGALRCMGSGQNFDGTALQATPTGVIYAATVDLLPAVGTGPVHVWNVDTGTQLTDPFTVPIQGHAVMSRSQPMVNLESGIITVAAPDILGNFEVSRMDTTQSNPTWSTTSFAAPGCTCSNFQTVTIAGGQTLREIGYSIDSYTSAGRDFVYLFYPRLNGSGFIQEQGAWCTYSSGTTGSCALVASLITSATSNAYLPTVAVNPFTATGWLSYWSDSTMPVGNLQMAMDRIELNAGGAPNRLNHYPLTGVIEAPCPQTASNGGAWADYDGFTIANASSFAPSLLRYLTDSTASACSGGFPQHVSVTLGAGYAP